MRVHAVQVAAQSLWRDQRPGIPSKAAGPDRWPPVHHAIDVMRRAALYDRQQSGTVGVRQPWRASGRLGPQRHVSGQTYGRLGALVVAGAFRQLYVLNFRQILFVDAGRGRI